MSYATIDHISKSLESATETSTSTRGGARAKRPPLQHAACFDQSDIQYDLHANGRSRSVVHFRSRSSSLDRNGPLQNDTPDTPSLGKSEESDDHATVKSGISFDLDATYPEVFPKKTDAEYSDYLSFGDKLELSYERNHKNRSNEYFYDRAGTSTDDDVYYSKIDDTFYNTSADVNDPLQIQRMSVSALFEKFCADEREVKPHPQPLRQASETCFRTNRLRGISSDRLGGMFVKKTNRNDRMSTNSLGDQASAGSCFSIFDKRKVKLSKLEKSKRLSTSALYDQSPTGSQITKNNRIRSTDERLYKNSNSDEIDKDQFYEQVNAPSTSKSDNFMTKFRFDENPLDRASVAKLYEKFCSNTPPCKPSSLDNSFQSSVILKELSLSETSSPKPELFSAASLSEKTSDIMSSTIKTHENIFNFNMVPDVQISDKNENCISEEHETSNTMQLLFEDPRSNRTSVSDIYEPCFSICLTPRQPSFKRGSLKNNWMELTSMDLKAIDDESPTTSKFISVLSPDTDPNNTDVFMSPDYQFSFSVNGDTLPTLADIHEDDSLEENSISEYSTLKLKLTTSKSISSRSSMQKLQPILFNDLAESDINAGDLIELEKLSIKNNCTELTVNSKTNKTCQISKTKQLDLPHKRTRCFPL